MKKLLNFRTPKKLAKTPLKTNKVVNSSSDNFLAEQPASVESVRKEPKKRGRKKKEKVDEKVLSATTLSPSPQVLEKKKAGRKGKMVNKEVVEEDNYRNFEEMKAEAENIENSLISSLRKENQLLRNLKSDVLLYRRLLGVTIDEVNGELFFTIEKDGSSEKLLSFSLKPENEMYHYFPMKNINCGPLGNFENEITFDKTEIQKFFYYMVTFVHERNV